MPQPQSLFLRSGVEMYLCYIDESGTSDIPGNSSHYVLAGLSIPISKWKECDRSIELIKQKYGLEFAEIHVAWMLRPYLEQNKIPNFEFLNENQRRSAVQAYRNQELLRLQKLNNSKLYRQTRKNYQKTEPYIHLTYDQRKKIITEIAETIGKWQFARLFAECVDKLHFDPTRSSHSIDEQSFEQVVSRFEKYLQNLDKKHTESNSYGLLIHDNNPTVAQKHTLLMKKFHKDGTFWTRISHIIETPLFVDSQLTSMVQIADLCGYALRRYLENGEAEWFDIIFQRADRKENIVVGVRHFTKNSCTCKICNAHRR
ncbi:MAG: DUF3800 domain-containing protein [Bellilinea sp.]|nr:DUF3800 domain-containing protein [Bellilinea sp.]